jgi:hypothetical protein
MQKLFVPNKVQIEVIHEELIKRFLNVADAKRADSMVKDKGSNLSYLGVSVPLLRQEVKKGFSFTQNSPNQILQIWDFLWKHSSTFEVLSAALEYYSLNQAQLTISTWQTIKHWAIHIDNWDHSDSLCRIYSFPLREEFESHIEQRHIYDQLLLWSCSNQIWLRRISVVSLKHYSGKNTIFLTFEDMIKVINNVIEDKERYVQLGVGWVLSDMLKIYTTETKLFIKNNFTKLGKIALRRAIRKLTDQEKEDLKAKVHL